MLDGGVDEFICIAADGVGYGNDGTSWVVRYSTAMVQIMRDWGV